MAQAYAIRYTRSSNTLNQFLGLLCLIMGVFDEKLYIQHATGMYMWMIVTNTNKQIS